MNTICISIFSRRTLSDCSFARPHVSRFPYDFGTRAKRPRRHPRTPSDLVGLHGEMRKVEMAALTGLSASAGKTAGLIMHEQVGKPSSLHLKYDSFAAVDEGNVDY